MQKAIQTWRKKQTYTKPQQNTLKYKHTQNQHTKEKKNKNKETQSKVNKSKIQTITTHT